MLRSKFFSAEQVEAIVRDFRSAGLEDKEVAALAFAEKIILNAYKVTQKDIDGLRAHGYSDADIFDIAATAAGRSFFSKLLDALGTEPDPVFDSLEESLRKTLAVGSASEGDGGD